MEKLSVVIITYNEEASIVRCIQSVRPVADEVVVLDSHSTDRTVELAEEMGAKVFLHPFTGYVSQKNRALQLASYDYVLSLDADEALDETLQQSILKAKQGFAFLAYRMNRCAFYIDRFIRHGAWYPEPKVRLVNRKKLRWGGLDPHDQIQVPPTTAVCHLKGELLHYICQSVEAHRIRSEKFSSIAAQSLYRAGKRANWVKILASPLWFFINDYLLRRGFINGKRGWQIACIQTRYHFLKYYKLLRLHRSKALRPVAGELKVREQKMVKTH